ncbi:GNAT family N-acetyltransferase [Chitinophaga silvisoli]|uniref:GNAT family N-acetyltransferase n=1 Tax=Chitinophaga silvisoli TaxID=2291814 RepID=A0A3E1P0P1_9BACT|nr:GNAT family N-acetyltransferase [Chitinophaga silvisoli]RFM33568.1 GNAT family N-acetyltransferase [Chitinophaga silvisoli]
MKLRIATLTDLDAITALENVCFPPNEAASRTSFIQRLQAFPDHFWVLESGGQLVGFINGMVTNNETIIDEMFASASLHDDNGRWQSVFGLAVAPEFRKQGYAGKLIHHLIEKSRADGREGVTLTCKEYLVGYYTKFGFEDRGISKSVHGGEVWHDMTLRV